MIVPHNNFVFFLLLGLIHEGLSADTDNGNNSAPRSGSEYHGAAHDYALNDYSHHTGQSKFNHPRYIPRYTKVKNQYFDSTGKATAVKPGANYDGRLYALYANEGLVPHTKESRLIKDPNDVHSVNMYTEKLRSHTRKMNEQGTHQSEPSNKRNSPAMTTPSGNKRKKTQ